MKKLLEKLFTEIPKILCAIIISFMVILPIFIGCAVIIAYTGVLLNYFNDKLESNPTNFSNGRFVRNLYEDLIMNQAVRIDQRENLTSKDLTMLIKDDFSLEENCSAYIEI